jgi:hypothetical protein
MRRINGLNGISKQLKLNQHIIPSGYTTVNQVKADFQHGVLEGRIGDEQWRVLDEHHSDSQLNGSSRIAPFDISTRSRLRVIRLRQIGPNHAGGYALMFM